MGSIAESITIPIARFVAATGVDRNKLYALIYAGEIESVLVGRKRLIIMRSWYDYLDRLRSQQAKGIGLVASPNPRARAGQCPKRQRQ